MSKISPTNYYLTPSLRDQGGRTFLNLEIDNFVIFGPEMRYIFKIPFPTPSLIMYSTLQNFLIIFQKIINNFQNNSERLTETTFPLGNIDAERLLTDFPRGQP